MLVRACKRWVIWPGLLAFEVLALCWPAFLNNGHAIVFPDTHSYFIAGRNAIDKIASILHPAPASGNSVANGLDVAMQKARAVRSAYYSVFTFVTADVLSLWLAVLIQALLLSAVLHLIYRLLNLGQSDRASIFVITLAATTTLSWLVSTVMPDVFAAVAVLLTCTVLLFWNDLSRLERILACVGIAASCVMHLSNPPLVFGVLCVGGALRVSRLWAERTRYATVLCGIGIALAATLVVSVVAFKQVSLTPNQPPFLLAHSIVDGPAKLYLREHCPQADYEMCKYLDRLDVSVDDFIWHENGVYSAVSLDSAARIRAEEKSIFWHASLDHPILAIGTTLRDVIKQLFDFTLQDFFIPSIGYASYNPQNLPPGITPSYSYKGQNDLDLGMWIRSTEPVWQQVLAVPEYAVVFFSLGYGVLLWYRCKLSHVDRQFFALIIAAVVINAILTAFSDTSARYEARVIWLIPMIVLAFAFRELLAR